MPTDDEILFDGIAGLSIAFKSAIEKQNESDQVAAISFAASLEALLKKLPRHERFETALQSIQDLRVRLSDEARGLRSVNQQISPPEKPPIE